MLPNYTVLISNLFRFPTLPDNWGPKAAARMKLNGDVELEARKERRERKRGMTKAQPESGDGLTKRARIRENKRQKRLKKSEEKKLEENGVINEASTVES